MLEVSKFSFYAIVQIFVHLCQNIWIERRSYLNHSFNIVPMSASFVVKHACNFQIQNPSTVEKHAYTMQKRVNYLMFLETKATQLG
jgi:hypothetical protein